MKLIPVAVAIFVRLNSLSIFETWVQKRTYGELEGFWEFPGGKLEPFETAWQALVREIKEEVHFDVTQEGKLLGIFSADYGEKRILLHVFKIPWHKELESADGQVVTLRPDGKVDDWGIKLLPANIRLVEHLCRELYDARS